MKTIAPAELQLLFSRTPAPSLLDVRTAAEFAAVHVPQARNIPLDQLEPTSLVQTGVLPILEPVYILCHSGQRAARAAEKFGAQGYHNFVVVEGGTQAWVAAGLPVNRGKSGVISLERQVRIVAGALVFTGVALGWFLHPTFFLLPAFVGAGLVFAGITDWCGMGLLLAKAPWNK